ncbi:hypothetical protein KIN20_019903 [Parelaphostrongylus tenuis]|uniref:Uncharacterized protein n=1 Tax=Parelaphostrongylus tenuis TaxID=148309 RepID=A0AAD5QT65_PARTN|nr:hypothetical protein KIN20_019903 [Parelaphostrongylus tenuis]
MLACRRYFMDENIFTVEPFRNRQNHRQILSKGQQNYAISKAKGCGHFPAYRDGYGLALAPLERRRGYSPTEMSMQYLLWNDRVTNPLR